MDAPRWNIAEGETETFNRYPGFHSAVGEYNHDDYLIASKQALHHDTGCLDVVKAGAPVREESVSPARYFPVLENDGIAKCEKHGTEYLMKGPCPSCSYEHGLRDSRILCAYHGSEHLRDSDCPSCTYFQGYESRRHESEDTSVDCTLKSSLLDPDRSPKRLLPSSSDLLKHHREVADSISTELTPVTSWLRNEDSGAGWNDGKTKQELEEFGRELQAHYYEDDDVEMIELMSLRISGLNDQLVKLLANEKRNKLSSEVDAAPMQLFLMISVRSNEGQPSLVGVDLTPFLKTGESFLYYTVGESNPDDAPNATPIELMANSVRSDLRLLSKLDSKALSAKEWASVREFHDKSSHIASLAVAKPLPQPAYIQELWKIWDEITLLFKTGVQNLGLLAHQGAKSTPALKAVTEGSWPGENEKGPESNTITLPVFAAEDEERAAVIHPTSSIFQSSCTHATGAESGWEHDQAALSRSGDHKHHDDSYLRSIWLSRFDSHLPEICRQSHELDPMLASLLCAVTMLLKYEHTLPMAQKKFLNSIRACGEDVIAGRSFYLAYSLQNQGSLIWDICWSIYFELSEDLPEEDDNFLSQLFHGRTSSCGYEEIRFPWSRMPKDNNIMDPEHSLGNTEAVKSAVEAPLLTGYDQMIEDAQKMLQERDRLGQPSRATHSDSAPKPRRKKKKLPKKEASRTMYDQMIENVQAAMREKDRLGRLQQETDEIT